MNEHSPAFEAASASRPELERSARERVSAPAIALQISAGLGALWTLGQALLGAIAVLASLSERELRDEDALVACAAIAVWTCCKLAVALVVWLGASRMKALRSRGFAFVAAWLAVLPCVGPCCWIGLPCGLWAVFVLLDEDVRRCFR